jgi:hypothetical protein
MIRWLLSNTSRSEGPDPMNGSMTSNEAGSVGNDTRPRRFFICEPSLERGFAFTPSVYDRCTMSL